MAHQRVTRLAPLLIAAGLTATCTACSAGDTSDAHSKHVSKATFKGKWPVTVDSGTLACHPTKGGSVTFSPDGTNDVYAENGTAKGWAAQEGWKDFREIWAIDPAGPGPNVDATDFDNEGHKLCTMNGV
jgi:hypothetical protein